MATYKELTLENIKELRQILRNIESHIDSDYFKNLDEDAKEQYFQNKYIQIEKGIRAYNSQS